jgi:hypothetical protein
MMASSSTGDLAAKIAEKEAKIRQLTAELDALYVEWGERFFAPAVKPYRQWLGLLRVVMERHSPEITIDDIERMARMLGFKASRDTIRKEMANRTKKEDFDRVSRGKWRITSRGQETLSLAPTSGAA